MFKKILSFVLSAIMIFSCLPMILFTASAADELTATFMDGDTVIQTITFTSGSQVTTPQYDRIKEGYIFLNWSYNDGKNNKTVSAGSKSSALSTDTVFTAVWAPRNAESTVYSETEVDGVYTWKYDIQKATKLQDTLPVNGSTNANSLSSNVSSSIAPNTKGINLKPGRLWEDTIMLKSFNEVIYSFRVQTTNGCGMAVYINGTKALE